MDYTEQIVAACEDALVRLPEMPDSIRQGIGEFLLTGVVRKTEESYIGQSELDRSTRMGQCLWTALFNVFPSLRVTDDSWPHYLAFYRKNIAEYEQLKNTADD